MSSIRGYLNSLIFLADSSWTRFKRNEIINLQDQKYQRKTWIIENDLEIKLFICVSLSTIFYFSNWKCWGGQLYETMILDGFCKPKYWILHNFRALSSCWILHYFRVSSGYRILHHFRILSGYWILHHFRVLSGHRILHHFRVLSGFRILSYFRVLSGYMKLHHFKLLSGNMI